MLRKGIKISTIVDHMLTESLHINKCISDT